MTKSCAQSQSEACIINIISSRRKSIPAESNRFYVRNKSNCPFNCARPHLSYIQFSELVSYTRRRCSLRRYRLSCFHQERSTNRGKEALSLGGVQHSVLPNITDRYALTSHKSTRTNENRVCRLDTGTRMDVDCLGNPYHRDQSQIRPLAKVSNSSISEYSYLPG